MSSMTSYLLDGWRRDGSEDPIALNLKLVHGGQYCLADPMVLLQGCAVAPPLALDSENVVCCHH